MAGATRRVEGHTSRSVEVWAVCGHHGELSDDCHGEEFREALLHEQRPDQVPDPLGTLVVGKFQGLLRLVESADRIANGRNKVRPGLSPASGLPVRPAA